MMQGIDIWRRSAAPAALGIVLVVVGLAVLGLRQSGVDVVGFIEEAGWPFFIIIPGLVLLAMAAVPRPPNGLGFAIAGSVVTTVGSILFYQQSTGHWESWAYAWVLVPGAAGLATTVYGLASRRGGMVTSGLWIVGVAAALFVAGFWYFETVFESGRVPVDLGTWWPVIVIAIGLLMTVSAVVGSFRSNRALPGDEAAHSGGTRP